MRDDKTPATEYVQDPSNLSSDLASEQLGRYRIEEAIGHGGMGEVYRGYDERLERSVALKRIHATGKNSEKSRQRFRREARALTRVRHPHVVEVYDWLEDEAGDWLVMELVEGQSLRALMRPGATELYRALEIGRDIASGLAVIHSHGIVHRDLKPANVMVASPLGQTKILDFGLAKRMESTDGLPITETISERGQILGTVRFMSPEQASGHPLDGRSDLFSLGMILYEMLASVPPFSGKNAVETLTQICTAREVPLQRHVPTLPGAVADLVRRLLEKEPDRRFAEAADVVETLDGLLAGLAAGASDVELLKSIPLQDSGGDHSSETQLSLSEMSPTTATHVVPGTGSSTEATSAITRWPQGLRWATAAAVICSAALLVGLFFWRSRSEPLDVAVLAPTSGSVDNTVESALVGRAIRGALARRLTTLEGISLRPSDEVDELEGSASEIARYLAVDEMITARFDCVSYVCQIVLSRVSADGGDVLWSANVSSRADDLLRLHDAVDRNFRRGYADREVRSGASDLEVEADDYSKYLALREESLTTSSSAADAVLAALEEIQRSSPRFLEAVLLQARVSGLRFFETQDLQYREKALVAFDRARDLAPTSPGPLFALADFALDVGDLDLMTSTVDSLHNLAGGHPQVEALEALLLERRGQPDTALERLRDATNIQPSIRLKRYLSMMEYRRGNFRHARELFEEILRLAPYDSDIRLNLANLEVMVGDPSRAITQYEALLEDSPDVGSLTNLGVAHMLLRQWSEAKEAFETANQLAPKFPVLSLNLADAELLLGDEESAKKRYRSIVERLDQDPNAAGGALWQGLTIKGQALGHLGEAERAVAAAQEAVRLAGDNPQVVVETATIFALAGEKTSSVVSIQRALDAGVDARWFSFPWFDELRSDPRLRERLPAPSAQLLRSGGRPEDGLNSVGSGVR